MFIDHFTCIAFCRLLDTEGPWIAPTAGKGLFTMATRHGETSIIIITPFCPVPSLVVISFLVVTSIQAQD